MHVIFTNGPPGCGKDTLGELIIRRLIKRMTSYKVIHARIKDVLYKATYAEHNLKAQGISYVEWVEMCNDRVIKETPTELLRGMSPRQSLIYQSEEVIKVRHGKDGVAIQSIAALEEEHGNLENTIIVFTDGGFTSEVNTIVRNLKLDRATNVTLVRVIRKDKSFRNDSRHYIKYPDVIVFNDGDLTSLETWTTLVLDRVAIQRGAVYLLPKPTVSQYTKAILASLSKLLSRDIGIMDMGRAIDDLSRFMVIERGA